MIKISLTPVDPNDAAGGGALLLPVNPEKIDVKSGAKFQSFSATELGEFQVPRGLVPFSISFDSWFPGPGRVNMTRDPNFVSTVETQEHQPPWIDLQNNPGKSHLLAHQCELWARAGSLLTFRLTTLDTTLDFLNAQVAIQNPFQYTIQGGRGDIFYHMELIEQRKLFVYAISDVRSLVGTGSGPSTNNNDKTAPGTYVPPQIVDPLGVIRDTLNWTGYANTTGSVDIAVDFAAQSISDPARGPTLDATQPNRNPTGTVAVTTASNTAGNVGGKAVAGSAVPTAPAAPSGENVTRTDPPQITSWVVHGDDSGNTLWGETLPLIALACYGDESQWPLIYNANIDTLKDYAQQNGTATPDPNFPDSETAIFPGQTLIIPSPTTPQWFMDLRRRQMLNVGSQRSAAVLG